MKLQRRRKFRVPRKKSVLFSSLAVIIVVLGAGLVWFFVFRTDKTVVSPLPQGVFRVLPKTDDQKKRDIAKFLSKNNLVLEGITRSSDSGIIVSLKDNGDVYLSEEKYLEELPSLQHIVSQLTMEGKRFKRLDLRFERPIIVL